MSYCGQEGLSITPIPSSDISQVRNLTSAEDPKNISTDAHPDDSLRNIAEESFADS